MIHFDSLASVLLEFPLAVVEWADVSGFQPPGNAMKVERVVAHAPRHRAVLRIRVRVRLAPVMMSEDEDPILN